MQRLGLYITMLLIVISAPAFAFPCSVCKCGDHAFFINNARLLQRGTWIITLENLYLNKNALPAGEDQPLDAAGLAKWASPLRAAHGEGLQSHQQHNLQVVLNYGLTDRLMLMASVPYTFNRFSQASETLHINGLGDPEVMAFAQLGALQNWIITVNAGARIPLGQTDYQNAAGELLEAHDQIGSGAAAGIFGLQFSRMAGRMPLFFSVDYQVNATNDRNFRFGNTFRFNAATQRQLSSRFDAIAEINGRTAKYDQENSANAPNTGGMVVYFSPGLRWHLAANLAFRGQVQIPVVENLNGVQDEKMNVRAGLVWAL